jgi:hypothetical protein
MSRLNATLGTNLAELRRVAVPCPDPPPCPACGGLTCFCRPRFFAGQILTEADLNQLQKYVVDKNRLHNRYVHGWGVVCGLQVTCNPCGDRVTVRSGYALSPCGDDIIVSEDDTAPICELIRKCRPVRSDPFDCSSLSGRVEEKAERDEYVEDWVLAICYQETSARGVMPLRSGSSTSSRCSCGGSSAGGCNCGCGGSQTSSVRMGNCSTATRTAAAACEPTLTCEGYTFTVYKAPPSNNTLEQPGGTLNIPTVQGQLADNILRCIRTIVEGLQQAPSSGATPVMLQQWFLSVKQGIHDLLTTLPASDCGLFDLLNSVTFPDPNSNTFESEFEQTLGGLALTVGELHAYCICTALLPPCPPAAECNCVPLATLKVRSRDCKVMSVCNWQARKFVLTFPDLVYWMEGTTIFQVLRERMEILCCGRLERRKLHIGNVPITGNAATAAAAPTAGGAGTTTAVTSGSKAPTPAAATVGGSGAATKPTGVGSSASPLAQLLSQSWVNRGTRVIDPITLAGAYLGLGDENGNALASPFEMANPGAFLAVNQMLRPTLEGVLPTELSQLMSQLAIQRLQPISSSGSTVSTPSAPAAPPDDLAALRQAVAELQATVKTQADEIAKLKKT